MTADNTNNNFIFKFSFYLFKEQGEKKKLWIRKIRCQIVQLDSVSTMWISQKNEKYKFAKMLVVSIDFFI